MLKLLWKNKVTIQMIRSGGRQPSQPMVPKCSIPACFNDTKNPLLSHWGKK